MKRNCLIVLNCFLVSAGMGLAVESCSAGEQISDNIPVDNIAWYGFAINWNNTYALTILGVNDESQKLEKLKKTSELQEYIKFFFTRKYVAHAGMRCVVKVSYDELMQIGRFLYDMSGLYDELYPGNPWGIPKISSPLDDDDKWTYIGFKIMTCGDIQCRLNVHFTRI